METDNNIPNKFDHSVPPTPLSVGGILYGALFEALAGEDIRRIVAGYVLPNPASEALHARFGFKLVGVFRENGRKLGRYWDVAWVERPLILPTT